MLPRFRSLVWCVLLLGLLLYASHFSLHPSPPETSSSERSPTPLSRVERECPYCAEMILTRAKVCKHCGRDVSA
jgi:predicted RNA-binding Zn-ribbon protein involved in translation (DUF1610 family)